MNLVFKDMGYRQLKTIERAVRPSRWSFLFSTKEIKDDYGGGAWPPSDSHRQKDRKVKDGEAMGYRTVQG